MSSSEGCATILWPLKSCIDDYAAAIAQMAGRFSEERMVGQPIEGRAVNACPVRSAGVKRFWDAGNVLADPIGVKHLKAGAILEHPGDGRFARAGESTHGHESWPAARGVRKRQRKARARTVARLIAFRWGNFVL